ncbi:MAG: metallophosphoesterase family protein [Thermoleophilia bacterium]
MDRRMRVGVVADTHVGEFLPRLPPEVLELMEGADLILHAGDVADPSVLEELREVAPVVAVKGNHDRGPGLDHLPRDIVVRVGGARIGLTHGSRAAAVELPAIAWSVAGGRPRLLGFHGHMRRRFRDVDIVVVGHLHMPIRRMVRGALVFSPGSVYSAEHDPRFRWSGPRRAAYRRYRSGLAPEARAPAVGMIEVGPSGVQARAIPLRRPIVERR